MVHGQAGSFQLMKSMNKSLILNVIRTEGPISRAEIAKRTNLTPPTVTNLVTELLESGLIIESERGTSTGGRKPILLRIHSEAFQVIGVDVGTKRIKVVATNLEGEMLDSIQLALPDPLLMEELVALLHAGVVQLMKKAGLAVDRLIGIGVAMHGLVNPERGYSIFAPNFGLRDIPIKDMLESSLNFPVEVENDVRAMALGESWFGNGQHVSDFICVNVGMGIGAGLIMDQQVYRGPGFTAGEFGHTTIEMEGPLCSCGNKGCLQALAAGPAIAERASREIKDGRVSIIHEIVKGDLSLVSGEVVHRAALQGDDLAIEVLAETGRYLGVGIANLINVLNPTKVIIGGGVSNAGDFVLGPILDTVRQRALQPAAKNMVITKTGLGEDATAIGAATLVLKKLFIP